MSRNGSGGYTAPTGSWNPATNGNSATAADWNALLADMVAAIEGSLAADGQTPMTGNLQMGGNKSTGLGAATTLGDALRLENLIAGADIASASTVTIPLEGNLFKITGSTTIAGFASTRVGRSVWVRFDGILTLTNSASFLMPGSADVVTAAGDVALFLYDSVGWRCAAYDRKLGAPAFSVYLTANQTVTPSTWTKVPFETKLFDTNSNFSIVTNRFTPNVPGYYQFNAGVLFIGVSINAFVALYKNGGTANYFTSLAASPTNPAYTGSALVYLNGTTDYVEIYANTGGTAVTGGAYTTFFQGFLARSA